VDLVATAEVSVSMTVDAGVDLGPLIQELRSFATVNTHENRVIIAAVGERLQATPGLGARLLNQLGDINVEMISMGANEINLSLVVRQEQGDEALRRLHRVLLGEGQ
jgi:aspartate kinase